MGSGPNGTIFQQNPQMTQNNEAKGYNPLASNFLSSLV